jgi:hypothetical protein
MRWPHGYGSIFLAAGITCALSGDIARFSAPPVRQHRGNSIRTARHIVRDNDHHYDWELHNPERLYYGADASVSDGQPVAEPPRAVVTAPPQPASDPIPPVDVPRTTARRAADGSPRAPPRS